MTSQPTEGKRRIDARALVCACALVISRIATKRTSFATYPYLISPDEALYYIPNLVWAAVLLAAFVVAVRRPSLLETRLLTLAAVGSAITACFAQAFGYATDNSLLFFVGIVFLKLAEVWSMIMIVAALSTLGSRAMLGSLVFGFSVGEAVALVLPATTDLVDMLMVPVIYALIVVMLHPVGSRRIEQIAAAGPPADLELTNPGSFLEPTNLLFVYAFAFSIASGYGLTLDATEGVSFSLVVEALLPIGMAAWIFFSEADNREDVLFLVSALLVIAGFILAPYGVGTSVLSADTLLNTGATGLSMLLWLVALAVGRRNPSALLPVFTLSQAVRGFGIAIGALLGHAANVLAATDATASMLVTEGILFAFVVFLLVGQWRFSFSETIRNVVKLPATGRASATSSVTALGEEANPEKPVPVCPDAPAGASVGSAAVEPDVPADPAASAFEERIARLVAEHDLTEREAEIFALLARGRNGRFVMEHFVISQNTMKSHVRHIYAKLGVHSHQELIDLVEETA